MNQSDIINKYQKFTTLYIAAHVLIYGMVAFFLDIGIIVPLAMQIALTAIAFLGSHLLKDSASSRDFSAMSLALTPAVLVYILSGHSWQLDAHMYFFAALAMVTAFQSVRAILFAATAIAIHHLTLNFVLPAALFPDSANFLRVVFHAVIVVIETGVLVLITLALNKMYRNVSDDKARAEEALKQAEEAQKSVLAAEVAAQKERVAQAQDIARKLEQTAGDVIKVFAREAESLYKVSTQISSLVDETSTVTQDVSTQSEETKQHVSAVLGAAQELSASIREISANVHDTISSTGKCVDAANMSKETLNALQKAVSEIDGVIQAITDVAEQTNLLALNATIEAARAGEMGKGFAVVAGEVKALANQTHNMTAEITSRVNTVKSNAQETFVRVEDIIKQIGEVNNKTSIVASAIEEQSAATQEIEHSIKRVSDSTERVSSKIVQIKNISNKSDEGKDALLQASQIIKNKSTELQSGVNEVIKNIRES